MQPPVEGAWVSATGAPAPVDGSVIGTFAVAGATSSIRADLSGGFEALDPNDLVLESSKVEPLPRFPSTAQPTLEQLPAPPSGSAGTEPALPTFGEPEPERAPSQETTGPRLATPLPVPAPRNAPKPPGPPPNFVGGLVAKVEQLLGPRPRPAVIVVVLAVALFSGITLSFLLASLVF
ncbi:MAG: hypothetical protein IPJ34_22430 [Myxococcales bacterium]|nr:hypothetical protein [Myxococcales bacterium]